MTAAVLAPMAVGGLVRYAALAGALAILVGAACFLAGIARLGFLANLFSRPVLVGYMAGIAFVMIASQLEKLTGIPVEGEEFIKQIRTFATGVAQAHWPTIALAGAVLAALLAMARWLPARPVHLSPFSGRPRWSRCFRWTPTELRLSVRSRAGCRRRVCRRFPRTISHRS